MLGWGTDLSRTWFFNLMSSLMTPGSDHPSKTLYMVMWCLDGACLVTWMVMLLITSVKHRESPIRVISFPVHFLGQTNKYTFQYLILAQHISTLGPWTKHICWYESPVLYVKDLQIFYSNENYLNVLSKHQSLGKPHSTKIYCINGPWLFRPLTKRTHVLVFFMPKFRFRFSENCPTPISEATWSVDTYHFLAVAPSDISLHRNTQKIHKNTQQKLQKIHNKCKTTAINTPQI